MPTAVQRVYVYGIIRFEAGRAESGALPTEGLAGQPVGTVARDGLAAIVSVLASSAEGFPLEEQLKEPERARSLVLDHHRVLRRTIDDRTVLPARFGALFLNEASVADALAEHRRDLVEALERVEGAREWGVKIFCDRAALSRHLAEEAPAMRDIRTELTTATDGRAFFLRRRLDRLGEEETQRAIDRQVTASRRSLHQAARADAAMKLQPASVHGRVDEMIWNGAFLVARPDEGRFFALVDELLQAHGSIGFDYEVTGPWPPFSFADCRLGG
jgi:hypothetical protein